MNFTITPGNIVRVIPGITVILALTAMNGYDLSQVSSSIISVVTGFPMGSALVPSSLSGVTGTRTEARLMVNNIAITRRTMAVLFMGCPLINEAVQQFGVPSSGYQDLS